MSEMLHKHTCICTPRQTCTHTECKGFTPAHRGELSARGPGSSGEPEISPAPAPLPLTDVNRLHVILLGGWLSSLLTQHRDADAGPAPLPTLHQISIHPDLAPKQNKRPCGQSIIVRPGLPSITTAFRYTK